MGKHILVYASGENPKYLFAVSVDVQMSAEIEVIFQGRLGGGHSNLRSVELMAMQGCR